MSRLPLSVLFAEDDEATCEIWDLLLSRLVAQHAVVHDGAMALSRFRAGGFDVVVSDVQMPVMDGLELAREILAITRETPVILVSGEHSSHLADQALALGVRSFYPKPLVVERIRGELHCILQEKQSRGG